MTVLVSPPQRRKPPAPEAEAIKPKLTAWDVPVVGGPRGVCMAAGFPVFVGGTYTKQWPYHSGSVLAGYYVTEYTKDRKVKGIHAWRMNGSEKLAYMGVFPSKDAAITKIEHVYERAQKDKYDGVQRVAPPPRKRTRAAT